MALSRVSARYVDVTNISVDICILECARVGCQYAVFTGAMRKSAATRVPTLALSQIVSCYGLFIFCSDNNGCNKVSVKF